MTLPLDPVGVALLVTNTFDALGIAHTIGGSIASSIAGEPRSSIDIDIVAALDDAHVDPLVAALAEDCYVDGDSLRQAIRLKRSANLIHHATQIKVDVFVAGGTPLDLQQISRRRAVDLGAGTNRMKRDDARSTCGRFPPSTADGARSRRAAAGVRVGA